ncbi:hypothetical protein CVT24_000954 [Panaeolus cyanescens]|uniref:Uncharacterized protein n=1 Tax=Panaeolus cyanescens TaxID=181874 RepID=A0A409YCM4_9AGAR|nr:hypothetical protein CVT24_000954 [Panaeolus cyanescens]
MEYRDSSILAGRDTSKQLTGLDGRVATHLCHQGTHYVISSPNQDYVPLPPIGRRELRLRANLRYGLEDHCQWPQFVVPKFKHLVTLPRKPTNAASPLHIIWWDPNPSDFVSTTSGVATGLGTLASGKLQLLSAAMTTLLESVSQFTNTSPTPSDNAMESFCILQNQLKFAMNTLKCSKQSFTQTVFSVTEFQRCFLHLHGFLSFMKTYRLRFDGAFPTPRDADNVMGGFTNNPATAQVLFQAGIPVWYIEVWDGTPLSRNILKVVDITMPNLSIVMGDHAPPFATIFMGDMLSEGRYAAIYLYAANHVASGDRFASRTTGTSAPPAAPSIRTANMHIGTSNTSLAYSDPRQGQWRDPQARIIETGRSRFTPLDSVYAPYSIPAWASALQNVHCSTANIADINGVQTQYVLPDPGLFAGSNNIQRYIRTFLQIRHAWLAIIASGGSPLLSQEWRHILNMDLTKPPPTGSSRTAQQRRQAWEKLQIKPNELNHGVQIQGMSVGVPEWNGQQYPEGTDIPASVIREILWWIYEQNFTHELIALDLRLTDALHPEHRTAKDLAEREFRHIAPCFGSTATSCFKLYTVVDRNVGLSANTLVERLPHIQSLAKLMKTWKGQPIPYIILQNCDRRQIQYIGSVVGAEFEKAVADFYCQMFWNQFGRAPQIPHRLNRPE